MVAIQIVLEASHDLIDFGMPSDNERFAKTDAVRSAARSSSGSPPIFLIVVVLRSTR